MDATTIIEEIGKRKQALELVLDIPSDDPAGVASAIDENVTTKKFLERIRPQVEQIKDDGEKAVLQEMVDDLILTRAKLLTTVLRINIPATSK